MRDEGDDPFFSMSRREIRTLVIEVAVVLVALIAGAVALLAMSPAHAQEGPGFSDTRADARCMIDRERVELVDAGEGRAILTYYNSAAGCSNGQNKVMTTPNGISARVVIDVNVDGDARREEIRIYPQDPSMIAYPPKGQLIDGETQTFLIEGGMS